MSLDIELTEVEVINCRCGIMHYITKGASLYEGNITHNLCNMAEAAGIYNALWRPYMLMPGAPLKFNSHDEEYQFEFQQRIFARDIIPYLENGLNYLKLNGEYCKKFNPVNGWGEYGQFVSFVTDYLNACKRFPDALIKTDR
jgi:hypothetical protein